VDAFNLVCPIVILFLKNFSKYFHFVTKISVLISFAYDLFGNEKNLNSFRIFFQNPVTRFKLGKSPDFQLFFKMDIGFMCGSHL
jgi:hypothetical protein